MFFYAVMFHYSIIQSFIAIEQSSVSGKIHLQWLFQVNLDPLLIDLELNQYY